MTTDFSDHYFMGEALRLAALAGEAGEIPVGALVVHGNTIVGRGYNQTQTLKDVTAHAEMLAITAAAQHLSGKYLTGCRLYVTLEPCVMCAGAIFWAQVDQLIYGAGDAKRGYARLQTSLLHPKTRVVKGVREEECQALLLNFFKSLRT